MSSDSYAFRSLIIHAPGQIGLYSRDEMARLVHARDAGEPLHTRTAPHSAVPSFGTVAAALDADPHALLLRDPGVLAALGDDDKKSLKDAFAKGIALCVPGNGSELAAFLGHKPLSGGPEEASSPLYAAVRSAGGRLRELSMNAGADRRDHFPLTSDVETELQVLAQREERGAIPGPTFRVSDSDTVPPNGPWNTGGRSQVFSYTGKGGTSRLWVNPYKLRSDDPQADYYLFVLDYSQGVVSYVQDCGQVGFYGNSMNLKLEVTGGNHRLVQYGPPTTVRQATVSFTLGAGLAGTIDGEGVPGGQLSVSAEWGVSFSGPEVTFEVTPFFGAQDKVDWKVTLPHVGWISPGVPANPGPAAKGYNWVPGFILQVPKGAPAQFKLTPDVDWEFDKTRGIKNKEDRWKQTFNLSFSA